MLDIFVYNDIRVIDMKIGIFDDDQAFMLKEKKFIHKINPNYFVMLFYDLEELRRNLNHIDVLFLDIEMPSLNGLDIAAQIKKMNADLEIVFVTNFEVYVYDSFKVRPLAFIPKNMIENRLAEVLLLVKEEYDKRHKFLLCKRDGIEIKIFEKNIIKIEKQSNICNIYCIQDFKNPYGSIRLSIKDVFLKLSKNFCLINQSQIINLDYVKKINDHQILLLNNEMYYPSRRYKKSVEKTYYEYLQEKAL